MKTAINVSSKAEADAIKFALENPRLRALMTVTGACMGLEPDDARWTLSTALEAVPKTNATAPDDDSGA